MRKVTAAPRASATMRALKRSGCVGLGLGLGFGLGLGPELVRIRVRVRVRIRVRVRVRVRVKVSTGCFCDVVRSTAEQAAAQSRRGSPGLCSEGGCGRPSPRRRASLALRPSPCAIGSSNRRTPCAPTTAAALSTAAAPGLQASTASPVQGGVVPASAWHAASRARDGVSDARGAKLGLVASAAAAASASAEAGWAGRAGPASSRSRARSSCVEGPAGVVGGDSILSQAATASRSPTRRETPRSDRQTEKRTA